MTKKAEQAEVQVAAVETAMHVMGRPLFNHKTGRQIIGKVGQSVETQFQRACRLAHLVCKDLCTDEKAKNAEIERALDRRDAGQAFVKAWDIAMPGSKDSLDRGAGGGLVTNAAGAPDAKIDASALMRSWERHMGRNDWMICRRVLGENYAVAQAVLEINPSYRDSTLARFREALDALILGQAAAGKCKRSANGCCSPRARERRGAI